MRAALQNGVFLGNATDQFIRYTFRIPVGCSGTGVCLHPRGSTETNILTVTFGSALHIATQGRFTHSTEIDWAPTMTTHECWGSGTSNCLSTFGFGIWKSVYVLPLADNSAAIAQLVPHTFYAGGHPMSILSDDNHAGFDVRVRVVLDVVGVGSGTLSVIGSWPTARPVQTLVNFNGEKCNVTVVIPAAQTVGVQLWHPHGHGQQALYNITATFTPSTGEPSTTTRRLGFRHIALVTVNDTDPTIRASAQNASGTGQFTMFFRVNGAPLYARGANKVRVCAPRLSHCAPER